MKNVIGVVNIPGNISLWMRKAMVEQSMINPDNISGDSVGFKGDEVKLGGGRVNPSVDYTDPDRKKSPLGGDQGGVGEIFGNPYEKGSFNDRLVESYAGPHDYLNSFIFYDKETGNIKSHIPKPVKIIGEGLNFVNVIVATPLVAFSWLPTLPIKTNPNQ